MGFFYADNIVLSKTLCLKTNLFLLQYLGTKGRESQTVPWESEVQSTSETSGFKREVLGFYSLIKKKPPNSRKRQQCLRWWLKWNRDQKKGAVLSCPPAASSDPQVRERKQVLWCIGGVQCFMACFHVTPL